MLEDAFYSIRSRVLSDVGFYLVIRTLLVVPGRVNTYTDFVVAVIEPQHAENADDAILFVRELSLVAWCEHIPPVAVGTVVPVT